MFDVDCPSCQTRVLLGPQHITGVRNLPTGIELGYRCVCGTPGTKRTGVRRAVRPSRP